MESLGFCHFAETRNRGKRLPLKRHKSWKTRPETRMNREASGFVLKPPTALINTSVDIRAANRNNHSCVLRGNETMREQFPSEMNTREWEQRLFLMQRAHACARERMQIHVQSQREGKFSNAGEIQVLS